MVDAGAARALQARCGAGKHGTGTALVDARRWRQALRAGRARRRPGLDVYEHEPEVAPELLELENVVLAAPRRLGDGRRPRDAMARLVAENVIAVLAGTLAVTPV